jgi:hypothetical protein
MLHASIRSTKREITDNFDELSLLSSGKILY